MVASSQRSALLQDPFFHLRVLHHLEQAPGQGLRRRVAPSDQEVEHQIRQEFRVQTWATQSDSPAMKRTWQWQPPIQIEVLMGKKHLYSWETG